MYDSFEDFFNSKSDRLEGEDLWDDYISAQSKACSELITTTAADLLKSSLPLIPGLDKIEVLILVDALYVQHRAADYVRALEGIGMTTAPRQTLEKVCLRAALSIVFDIYDRAEAS